MWPFKLYAGHKFSFQRLCYGDSLLVSDQFGITFSLPLLGKDLKAVLLIKEVDPGMMS